MLFPKGKLSFSCIIDTRDLWWIDCSLLDGVSNFNWKHLSSLISVLEFLLCLFKFCPDLFSFISLSVSIFLFGWHFLGSSNINSIRWATLIGRITFVVLCCSIVSWRHWSSVICASKSSLIFDALDKGWDGVD